MTSPRILVSRLLNAVTRRWRDRELNDEIQHHLDQLAEHYRSAGLSGREARLAARRDFGGIDQVKEVYRDQRGWPLLDTVGQDVRYALRQLKRNPGFATTTILTLAIGIGANTALFSGVNGLLLKKLPVKDPDSLVRLRWGGRNDMATDSSDYGSLSRDGAGLPVRTTFSYPMFQQFLADNRTMAEMLACAPLGRVTVVIDGHAEIASAFISSGNYYRMLGLTASPGRAITPEDDQPTAPAVAVISNRYWRSRFAADPRVIGKTIRTNNVLVTIIGVIAPQTSDVQQPVGEGPDIGVPLALDSQFNVGQPRLNQPTSWWVQVMGRLKPGVTASDVQANLDGVFQRTARAGFDAFLASASPADRSLSQNSNRTQVPHLLVDSGSRGIFDANASDVQAVTILSVVVVLVLLIVCANVANLLLSRATTRQKEVSIRLSMGATRARLVRQLLTESVLLAAVGGALGILVGRWGQPLLPGAAGRATSFDWRILLFVSAVTMATGIVFGLAPALRATATNVSTTLKTTSRGVAGSRSVLGRSLLVAQVAISLVLLIGAGLFLHTLQNLRHVDVGFNPRQLVLFRVNPQLNRYEAARITTLYTEMLGRLREVPGVRAVALSQPALLSGSVNSTGLYVSGRTYAVGQHAEINRVVVSPSFFETMEMPLVAGRGLTARDSQGALKVAVINEAAARTYFASENPIGQRFGSTVETSGQLQIIGILRDAKYNSLRDSAPPTMYVSYLQNGPATAVFEVRTMGDPLSAIGAIREAVRKIDSNLPLMDVSTQAEQAEQRFLHEKVLAQAYTLFGGLAVLLASVGLFGLMSYSVSRRINEIGIRLALGAQPQQVLRFVMGESMRLVIVGVGIGLAIALAASRFIASLLFGLAATDLDTILVATTAMLFVSAIAGYLPARRASRVDPVVALRYE